MVAVAGHDDFSLVILEVVEGEGGCGGRGEDLTAFHLYLLKNSLLKSYCFHVEHYLVMLLFICEKMIEQW